MKKEFDINFSTFDFINSITKLYFLTIDENDNHVMLPVYRFCVIVKG